MSPLRTYDDKENDINRKNYVLHGRQSIPEDQPIDVRISMPWGYVVGRWYGNRKVRPLLALHGWLDNMGTWNNLLPLLPPHLGVLCIDMPGHGHSSKMPQGIVYHAPDYVCVILRLMEEYGWQKVSILAHSMSAMLSFVFAAIYPHRLDMLVSIDVVRTRYLRPPKQIEYIRNNIEKYMVEDERFAMAKLREPPSYTYEEMKRVMHIGSERSVSMENCKNILERNATKSSIYPDKYYFSRDGRVKFYFEFLTSPPFAAELARAIRDVPFCAIKGSESDFINEDCEEVIQIMRENNPYFELHEVKGTHHVHLNNAEEVAAIINPFICKHRPPVPETWSIDDSDGEHSHSNKVNLDLEDEDNLKRRKRKSNL